MKWYLYLLFGLILLIAGYLLGVFLPFNLGPCEIIDTPITKGDYYGNWINSFVAFGTCSAVIISLFLEEIKGTFKKVSFGISLNNKEALEHLINVKINKKAIKYYNDISISNNGNINAQNCELYLESAVFFKSSTSGTGLPQKIENKLVKWGEDTGTCAYIPSKGKKILRAFEIIAPKNQVNPDEKEENTTSAMYKFMGIPNELEAISGKWELTYSLYSTNSKLQRFKLIVTWNGEWEERQQDMKESLTAKIELL